MTSPERITPRQSSYLWVIGPGSDRLPAGHLIGDRYEAVEGAIWRDVRPDTPPTVPETFPETVLPYLHAHVLRLHVPGVYDVVPQPGKAPWIVLENVPINPRSGKLYPALGERWDGVEAVRQLSWLWQVWQLWEPLHTLGVATSLLVPENLRVEGWRVRLRQFYEDTESLSTAALAPLWQTWVPGAHPAIAEPLQNLCTALTVGAFTAEQLTVDLNYLLLCEAAGHPLRLQVAGGTSPGPLKPRNEDACYPEGVAPDTPMPRLGIVCDGVGGHEAGEVASQLVVRSLQLQLQGLIKEADSQNGLVPPRVIAQQIEAAIRVANDVVNRQNDLQGRSDRQRMGTTLVLALVLPQRLQTDQGWNQVNELYIAHVGDSRAYWITPDYCHLLTVDDDIAGREVQAGRQFYRSVCDRADAGALTQAIGTRDGHLLRPHIQRHILDEDGVVLLCSDGLSDNQRIEAAWANYIGLIVKDIISLESAVAAWIELANQKNGHDNASVVLMQCKLRSNAFSSDPNPEADPTVTADTELSEASRALLYGDDPETQEPPQRAAGDTPPSIQIPRWWVAIVAGTILLCAGLLGWWVAGKLTPSRPLPGPETVE